MDAVLLLTRPRVTPEGGDVDDYYRAIREHPTALAVKLAEIADNTDQTRAGQLDPAARERLASKYRHALAVLEG